MKNLEIDVLENLEIEEKNEKNLAYEEVLESKDDTFLETQINEKEKNNILKTIFFVLKYVFTSALVFFILLFTTNYSAYISIAKSYIYKEEMEKESEKIISSVNAAVIKTKVLEKKANVKKDNKKISKYSIKKLKQTTDKHNLNLDIEITPYENRVIIPKIGKNIPLLDIKNRKIESQVELNDIFMKELENGVIRYPGSARPGKDGNTFIFGHSSNFPWIKGEYNDVFALLDKVEYGNEIILYYGQKKYTYKIREKKVITPGDVSILKRNKKKSEITLMTCWPLGTTLNRLIVIGELVEE